MKKMFFVLIVFHYFNFHIHSAFASTSDETSTLLLLLCYAIRPFLAETQYEMPMLVSQIANHQNNSSSTSCSTSGKKIEN